MIYADNAATTQLDIDAYEAMKPFLLEEYGNISQPYSFSRIGKNAVKDARTMVAKCIGADSDEIYFTSCGTESDNWAIKMGSKRMDQIITSVIEHHAVLNSCKAMQNWGKIVKYLPVNNKGEVDSQDLVNLMGDQRSLVSVMFANNEIGTIEPIKELADITRKKGGIFHTDAVQAVGHIPIDVHDLGVDMLSASGHKFNAPKGIGFLYIKRGTEVQSFFDGGAQEKGLRAGTENVASIVAMACALEKNCLQMSENEKHLKKLESIVISILESRGLDFVQNGSNNRIPGNLNLSFADVGGEVLLHRLDLKKICISTGSACDSVNTQISHVIRAIDVPAKYAEGTIRISFGKNNTESEAKSIAEALIDVLMKR